MKGRKPDEIAIGSHVLAHVPRPPAWLSKDAKAEWRRVAPVLVERGVLTVADLAALEGYAVAMGHVRTCQTTIDSEGLFYAGATGPKRHPAVTTQDAALKTARLFAAEFGLTPFARSRTAMQAPALDAEPSPLDL